MGILIISLAVWLVELVLVEWLGVPSIIFFIGVCCLGFFFTLAFGRRSPSPSWPTDDAV